MSGQRSELLVCFVVREVILVETSQHQHRKCLSDVVPSNLVVSSR